MLAKRNNQPDWSNPSVMFPAVGMHSEGRLKADDQCMDESRGKGHRRIQCLTKPGVSYASWRRNVREVHMTTV